MKRIRKDGSWTIYEKIFVSLLLIFLGMVWPILVISFLVISLGSYIIIDGIFSLVNALRRRKTESNWDWQFLAGMFGILGGVLTFFNPFVIVAVASFLLFTK